MKIIYVAKHNSGGNDDEGAIADALIKLGHDVLAIDEGLGHMACDYIDWGDFVLFHKWGNFETIKRINLPKVFWYFDLVEWEECSRRTANRVEWMNNVLPLVDLGFCTDGDFAAKHPDKLITLRQGADDRLISSASFASDDYNGNILFAGGRNGGPTRESFVDQMRRRYAGKFTWLQTGPNGAYGADLAKIISKHDIVVAPDSPVTDKYWSNRIYVMLGLGAFLIHPYCKELARDFEHGEELLFYTSREGLFDLIDLYSEPSGSTARFRMRYYGHMKTINHHTYKHRVKQLCDIVKERVLA